MHNININGNNKGCRLFYDFRIILDIIPKCVARGIESYGEMRVDL